MRGGARRPHARRSRSGSSRRQNLRIRSPRLRLRLAYVSVRPRAPTKQMGLLSPLRAAEADGGEAVGAVHVRAGTGRSRGGRARRGSRPACPPASRPRCREGPAPRPRSPRARASTWRRRGGRPGFAITAAAARMPRCFSWRRPRSSAVRRHFTSGLRRSTPRFEHGASTSTRSQRPLKRTPIVEHACPRGARRCRCPAAWRRPPTSRSRAACGSIARMLAAIVHQLRQVRRLGARRRAGVARPSRPAPGRAGARSASTPRPGSCTSPAVKAAQRAAVPRSTMSPSGASAVGRVSASSSSRSRAAERLARDAQPVGADRHRRALVHAPPSAPRPRACRSGRSSARRSSPGRTSARPPPRPAWRAPAAGRPRG